MKFFQCDFFYPIFVTKNIAVSWKNHEIFSVRYWLLTERTMKFFLRQIGSINPHWYRYWCISTSTVPHTAPLPSMSTIPHTLWLPMHRHSTTYAGTVPHTLSLPMHRYRTRYGTNTDTLAQYNIRYRYRCISTRYIRYHCYRYNIIWIFCL